MGVHFPPFLYLLYDIPEVSISFGYNSTFFIFFPFLRIVISFFIEYLHLSVCYFLQEFDSGCLVVFEHLNFFFQGVLGIECLAVNLFYIFHVFSLTVAHLLEERFGGTIEPASVNGYF